MRRSGSAKRGSEQPNLLAESAWLFSQLKYSDRSKQSLWIWPTLDGPIRVGIFASDKFQNDGRELDGIICPNHNALNPIGGVAAVV
jgi:hypothetical protein